jgi:MHS family proline/betaine transporter-like MFS transporter
MTSLSQTITSSSGNNDDTSPSASASASASGAITSTSTSTSPAIGIADMSQQSNHHNQGGGDSIINTIIGVMGNVLEWYDFALFGFFSDVIAEVFFPPVPEGSSDNTNNANLMKSFVIFGSAFLMRPIGGLIIGYIGDKHGRKDALTKSLFLMAIPTTLMGCLPTYKQVGVLSTILLCICRLIQGISVGGQLPASLVYTVEKRPKSQWGYYGSLPMVAANVGTLLGNICGATMRSVLTEQQLLTWGWRIPFFSGILIAFVSCYLNKYGTDVSDINIVINVVPQQGQVQDGQQQATQTQQATEDSRVHTKPHNPIKVAFRRENRLALLSTSITPMLWASGFYVSFVWIAIYMEELMDPPIQNAFWINSMSLLLGMTFVLPIAGHISDRIGSRVGMMTVSGLLLTGLGPVCLIVISKGNPITAFLSQLLLGLLLSFYGGPLCAWLVENFSPEVRMTSASIGYDIRYVVVVVHVKYIFFNIIIMLMQILNQSIIKTYTHTVSHSSFFVFFVFVHFFSYEIFAILNILLYYNILILYLYIILLYYYIIIYSHAIAGGFSPAIATALYTNFGINYSGLVYVVFGSVSVAGLYINYCFGQGDKESDTGTGTSLSSPSSLSLSPDNSNKSVVVEMQQTNTTTSSSSSSSSTTTKESDKTSFKNIV